MSATTVDADPARNPDVLGDVTEPETLEAAGLSEATALVVTVDDDATALLTAAMARALAPEVELLVRVTDAEKTGLAVRAGADYVLSVQQVCARLVAAEVYGERGWTVVAVLRDGATLTAPETTVAAGDEVVVAGSDEAIAEFERTVDTT